MFQALQTLLATVASLSMNLVLNGDGTITVTVMPKGKKEGENALNTPLSITGTAEELDAEFAGILAKYNGKRLSLAEQLEATEAILEAAKQEASKKATTAVKKGSSKASTGTSPATGGEEEEEEPGGGDENASSSTSAAPASPSALASTEPAAAPAASNVWE